MLDKLEEYTRREGGDGKVDMSKISWKIVVYALPLIALLLLFKFI
jgi:hypothetical protein